MTCQEMVDFLMAYLEDELSAEERAAFDAHLGECPPCIVYLESYQETVRAGKAACEHPDDPVPVDVPEGLVQAILAARRAD